MLHQSISGQFALMWAKECGNTRIMLLSLKEHHSIELSPARTLILYTAKTEWSFLTHIGLPQLQY